MAPLKKGSVVGKMFVFDKDNMVIDEVNLISNGDAYEIGFRECLDKVIKVW